MSGTLLLTAFLLVALVIAVQGAFQTRAGVTEAFALQSKLQAAQTALEELLRLQIDEANSLRGYALTRDSFYVDQYRIAADQFDAKERAIRETLQSQRLVRAQLLLHQYAQIQSSWRAAVALPVLRHPTAQLAAIDKRDKFFSDQEQTTVDAIRVELVRENDVLARKTRAELARTAFVRAFWLLLFGLLAILFNAYRSRLNWQLEEERTTTEILQQAFRSESAPLPNCDVGGAYLSASSHLAVGGDVYDVYRLSDNLALLMIADVSGKGVDAAVLTAFIKFTIRGIALRHRDPAAILAEFNTAFAQAVEDPYAFVSMWVGTLDTDDHTLRYASAGHDSAFIRRCTSVQQLAVTGPVLGVMEEPFKSRQTVLEAGDMLVLATDGLTEARDRSGEMLTEKGAMELIAEADHSARGMAEELALRVRALGGGHLRDDLAILVVRALPLEPADA